MCGFRLLLLCAITAFHASNAITTTSYELSSLHTHAAMPEAVSRQDIHAHAANTPQQHIETDHRDCRPQLCPWLVLTPSGHCVAQGIETVRRDNCLLVRNVVTTSLEKILMEKDVVGAQGYVRNTISDLLMNRMDLSLLVITKAGAQLFGPN